MKGDTGSTGLPGLDGQNGEGMHLNNMDIKIRIFKVLCEAKISYRLWCQNRCCCIVFINSTYLQVSQARKVCKV